MLKLVTPLEFILTKNAPVSPLELTLTKLLDLKSHVFTFFQKRSGGTPSVRPNSSASSLSSTSSISFSSFSSSLSLRALPLWLALLAITAAPAVASAEGWQHVGAVTNVQVLPNGVELTAGTAHVHVVAVSDSVIRVRVAPDGNFPKDLSWAILPSNAPAPKVTVQDSPQAVEMTTPHHKVRIQKSPLLIAFLDPAGNLLQQDYPHLPMAWNQKQVRVWKTINPDDHFYGLGDKAGPLNRRSLAYTMWNYDAFGWQESTDPLYKSIPFFMVLRHGVAHGILFDNTYRSSFDFGKESEDFYSFGAQGGELNYFSFTARNPSKSWKHTPASSAACRCRRSGAWATSNAATATIPRRACAKSRALSAKRRFPLT